MLPLASIEDALEKGLLPEVILLLPKMGRDIGYGRSDAKGLM